MGASQAQHGGEKAAFAMGVARAARPLSGAPLAVSNPDDLARAIVVASNLCLKNSAVDAGNFAAEDDESDSAGGGDRAKTRGVRKKAPDDRVKIDVKKGDNPRPEVVLQALDGVSASARLVASRTALLAAVDLMGTHTNRYTDARNGVPILMSEPVDVAVSAPGLHSASVCVAEPITFGGDAKLSGHMQFLGTALRGDDGEVAPLALRIARSDNAALAALAEALSPAAVGVLREVGVAVRGRFSSPPTPRAVPDNTTQLLHPVFVPFPNGGGSEVRYVAVSPLHSAALAAELVVRYRAMSFPEDRARGYAVLPVRRVHTGGTQPQNAGLAPKYGGGSLPRLCARVPNAERAFATAAAGLRRGSLSFSHRMVTREAREAFRDALTAEAARPNAAAAERIRAAATALCRDILSPVREVAAALSSATADERASLASRISGETLDIVLLAEAANGDRKADADEVDRAADAVSSLALKAVVGIAFGPKGARQKLLVDDRLRDSLFKAARAAVRLEI